MRTLGRIMDHVRLVTRMAQTTGTDLSGALEAGDLSREGWADIVHACRTCGWTGKCGDWLDSHQGAGCAPETCLNRARFEELKACTDTQDGD